MDAHTHLSPVHAIWFALIVVIVMGTGHLLALSHDNRIGRAWLALGL